MASSCPHDQGAVEVDRFDHPTGRQSSKSGDVGGLHFPGRPVGSRHSARYPYLGGELLMSSSPKEKPPIGPVAPELPPESIPLDQTTAPIHYEGDTSSV